VVGTIRTRWGSSRSGRDRHWTLRGSRAPKRSRRRSRTSSGHEADRFAERRPESNTRPPRSTEFRFGNSNPGELRRRCARVRYRQNPGGQGAINPRRLPQLADSRRPSFTRSPPSLSACRRLLASAPHAPWAIGWRRNAIGSPRRRSGAQSVLGTGAIRTARLARRSGIIRLLATARSTRIPCSRSAHTLLSNAAVLASRLPSASRRP
jgi:hypothetical protein